MREQLRLLGPLRNRNLFSNGWLENRLPLRHKAGCRSQRQGNANRSATATDKKLLDAVIALVDSWPAKVDSRVKRITAIEAARGEIARTERSHLARPPSRIKT